MPGSGRAGLADTDLERSTRALYRQRNAFGGKKSGRSFGVSVGQPARFDVSKRGVVLAAVHDRLSGVEIKALSYARFINCYDRPETLFYPDPP